MLGPSPVVVARIEVGLVRILKDVEELLVFVRFTVAVPTKSLIRISIIASIVDEPFASRLGVGLAGCVVVMCWVAIPLDDIDA